VTTLAANGACRASFAKKRQRPGRGGDRLSIAAIRDYTRAHDRFQAKCDPIAKASSQSVLARCAGLQLSGDFPGFSRRMNYTKTDILRMLVPPRDWGRACLGSDEGRSPSGGQHACTQPDRPLRGPSLTGLQPLSIVLPRLVPAPLGLQPFDSWRPIHWLGETIAPPPIKQSCGYS
jgi:hypothetical protein